MSCECDKCGEHCLDCKCVESSSWPSNTSNTLTNLEVYILVIFSKTWTEVLGVYSSEGNAKKAYNTLISRMNGSNSLNGLTILRRKIDEN